MNHKALLVVALMATPVLGLEPSMMNMSVPTGLEVRQAEVRVLHRFAGKVGGDALGNFLGMDEGANTGMGLRAPVWKRLEINAGFTRDQQEYFAGASYAHNMEKLQFDGQLEMQFFSYRLAQAADRRQNVIVLLSIQSLPAWDRVRLCGNLGYDAYNLHAGTAVGMSVEVAGPLALMSEYYPVIGRKTGETYLRSHNAYCLGLKLTTGGHHFVFTMGNNTEIGTRRMMLGSTSRDLHFGFNIQRLLEW